MSYFPLIVSSCYCVYTHLCMCHLSPVSCLNTPHTVPRSLIVTQLKIVSEVQWQSCSITLTLKFGCSTYPHKFSLLQDGTVAVWNVKSPTDITLRMTLKGHESWVYAVDFTETSIISGSSDSTIKVQSCVL